MNLFYLSISLFKYRNNTFKNEKTTNCVIIQVNMFILLLYDFAHKQGLQKKDEDWTKYKLKEDGEVRREAGSVAG